MTFNVNQLIEQTVFIFATRHINTNAKGNWTSLKYLSQLQILNERLIQQKYV